MPIEVITIGDKAHEVEVKPVTVIVPSTHFAAGPPIRYPSRFELGFRETLYHALRVKKLHPEFEATWKLFFANTTPALDPPPSCDPDKVREMGEAAIHLMGLIDLTLKLNDKGVPIVWIRPETFMMPDWQVALADLAIFFSKRGATDGQASSST